MVLMRGIYVASKAKHGHLWQAWRDRGAPIVSTWIDESGEGQTTHWGDLWRRCVEEAASAAVTLLYVEPGDVLKGALVEVGAAFALGRPVLVVGDVDHSWINHRCVLQLYPLQLLPMAQDHAEAIERESSVRAIR